MINYYHRSSYALVYDALSHTCIYQSALYGGGIAIAMFNHLLRNQPYTPSQLYIEVCGSTTGNDTYTGGYSDRTAFNTSFLLIERTNDVFITNQQSIELTLNYIPEGLRVHGFLLYKSLVDYEPFLYITSHDDLYFHPESTNRTLLIPAYQLVIR